MTAKFDVKLIVKLAVWSLVVGAVLYSLELSPGEIYGWIGDTIASLWGWLVGTGLEYILLGATIVVPIYLISRLRSRSSRS
ncbi:hypothetical protein GCM10017044_06300 [Kordiimonas sediminis]|uniref:DUF6460 domain-containing protein n=1 Tax=Kordiimonas sediminis TaxID=1735581 RepID=A0A919ANU0_9PROT|nr:DUF6460 domain-containing protein [Kordiimonas sediminis]GHF14914.1 hypothetical protein GCM10017044_06300 [Kordiimonas sediminis]